MSEFGEAKPHPIMGARDVAAQYAGLETRVLGIEKTVDNLGRYMRDENSALRRDMADGNAALKHEMSSQNATIIAAIDKLTQTAATSNSALRTEFGLDIKGISERYTADIKAVSDKQGMRANTLIALCTFGLLVMGYVFTMNNRPTDAAIADLKASLVDLKASTAKNEADFVPKAQIDKMQAQIDRHEASIIPKDDAARIRQLLDDAQRKRDQEAAEDRQNLRDVEGRLRLVEQQKVAK